MRQDVFKYTVSLKCPHDGESVRDWLWNRGIVFVYSTARAGNRFSSTVEYHFVRERDAVLFTLRWG